MTKVTNTATLASSETKRKIGCAYKLLNFPILGTSAKADAFNFFELNKARKDLIDCGRAILSFFESVPGITSSEAWKYSNTRSCFDEKSFSISL